MRWVNLCERKVISQLVLLKIYDGFGGRPETIAETETPYCVPCFTGLNRVEHVTYTQPRRVTIDYTHKRIAKVDRRQPPSPTQSSTTTRLITDIECVRSTCYRSDTQLCIATTYSSFLCLGYNSLQCSMFKLLKRIFMIV